MTRRRVSGVLLHPTSLPGPHGSGDLGAAAYHFVDWLVAADQQLWQVLPLGGIGPGHSPYMSSSAFAGNPLLIDLAELQRRGWLEEADLQQHPCSEDRIASGHLSGSTIDFDRVIPWRLALLEKAARVFFSKGAAQDREDFAVFCRRHADWLEDYALFMALAQAHDQRLWCEWPQRLVCRDPVALADAVTTHAQAIGFWKFAQWSFFRQWQALRAYANGRGVRIIGDVPIFVAWQSADVWAHQSLFELDARGYPQVVAGVPPDFFSPTGQRWGNPLYRWPAHQAQGFAWWIARMRSTFELVDEVRIDHFRGFAACWEIPAHEPTAIEGRWVPAPGRALFDAIAASLGPLPVIAEDLGVITEDVEALRRELAFPGMRILQFAFGGDADNPYLPHRHERDTVVYTGTHDNNTSLGWWDEAPESLRQHVRDYLGSADEAMPWALIRAALSSVADTAIVPMQDVLGLDASGRMNIPGQAQGNWGWRFDWAQVNEGHARRLAQLTRLYGRSP